MDWGQWSSCDFGVRTRQLEVVKPQIGRGVDCPRQAAEEEGFYILFQHFLFIRLFIK